MADDYGLALVDEEIGTLQGIRENVATGRMRAQREADGRLTFKLTAAGKRYVENMLPRHEPEGTDD
jgi:hypothetical protein